jgi:hypothetical protein
LDVEAEAEAEAIPQPKMSTVTTSSVFTTATDRATPQGGVLEGVSPNQYNPSNPIILFIIQVRSGRLYYM